MASDKRASRRRYSEELKARVMAECGVAGASVAKVVHVFGAARPHHAYLFANRRANRMKVLVHDGIGIWLAARRLHQGKFIWPRDSGSTLSLTRAQLDALVLGLPWQRLGVAGVISVL